MTCLIVNHENTTWNYYTGRDRAYLLPAAIFRMGGAAVLMSNRCACLKLQGPNILYLERPMLGAEASILKMTMPAKSKQQSHFTACEGVKKNFARVLPAKAP